MKKWKSWQIFLFALFCIFLNLTGRHIAVKYNLMLWLDSFGTVLCAYIGGPVCGSIVGVTGNIVFGMINGTSYVYALTSVVIGVIVGLAAKKDYLDTMFGTMTVAAVAAFGAILISVPLNILFYDGFTGNMWGNGVVSYLHDLKWPWLLCVAIGQFYVDFLDKFITLTILYIILRIIRALRQRRDEKILEQHSENFGKVFKALPLFLVLGLSLTGARVEAEEAAAEEIIDYNDYVQTVFSSSNGLPCGEANDIEQTNDGILWIGTYAGLYRYNGKEFRWMDDYDSVRNVNCLYVDAEGRLWIGTNDNGLSISINEKISNVIDQSKGLPSNSVRSIIQGSDGYYYVGTTSSMQILTLNDGLKIRGTLREINYADRIAADDRGHVAAVTSDGRLFLLRGGQILSSLRLEGRELFSCCCFDPEGNLMAGTSNNRIYTYDISSGRFKKGKTILCSSLLGLNDLCFLDTGEIFITADNGIGYLDENQWFHSINSNDFNNSIDNVLIDYQGNLWFTSSRLGLLRLAQSAFKDIYSTVGLEHKVVNTVTRWKDRYYIGTDSGIDVTDSTCKVMVQNALTKLLYETRIRCMTTDSKGSLWICSYGQGLIEVEADGTRHVYDEKDSNIGKKVRLGIPLSDGSFLAAGELGMVFIEDHEVRKQIEYTSTDIHSVVLTLMELPDGRILAGTDGDGLAVIEDGEVTSLMTREDGLSSGVILRTVQDPKTGGVFLVTSNGLCYMDDSLSVRCLENFPYFNNYDLWIKDEETVFVLSSAGIYVVSHSDLVNDKEGMTYDLLDARRGLGSALVANSWNYMDEKGNLFLSCDNGAYIVDTNRYALSTRSYRMNLNSIRLDGVPYNLKRNNTIQLGRGVRRMELVPEIINYTIQDPIAGYYLEGIDDQWVITPQSGLSTIIYNNLPSGEYKLHLAVFDNNKENILEERTFRVIKDREIYDETWFLGYILAVAMLFVAWVPWFFMQRALARAEQRIRMGNETIMAIANTVDAKDTNTSQHSYRVSLYSVEIARRMGFSKKECENIRQAARMHDIGKIGIPDRVLNKPSRLTDEEYAIMKSHVTRGSEILQGFTLIDHVVEGARYHHERFDGKGYPDGLRGDQIPVYGRIIGVADAFDAMTANRVYRKQLDLDYVLGEMKRCRGTQFDPECVDILLELIDEGIIDVNAMYAGIAEAGEKEAEKKEAEKKETEKKDAEKKDDGKGQEGGA